MTHLTVTETSELIDCLVVGLGQRLGLVSCNSWASFSDGYTVEERCITFDSYTGIGSLKSYFITLEEDDCEIVIVLNEAYTWMQMLRFVVSFLWADRWLAEDFEQEGYDIR